MPRLQAETGGADMGRRYWAIVLNYRHWSETIRCVESLLACHEPPEKLVVCDNGSADGSFEAMARWAEIRPGVVEHALLTRMQAEAGELPENRRILLVDNDANLGYAGGNNVGLRMALAAGAPFMWVLNNDTTVMPDAPTALLDRMDENRLCGLCGALTRYMDDPEVVQCLGGGWHKPVWGRGGLYGDGLRLPLGTPPPDPGGPLDYVNGASVFVRQEFLREVGLMDEAYFLYCEELDWAARAARSRWGLCWAPGAQVLHAEGVSTGVSNRRGLGHGVGRALTLLRSRLLYAWKHHPLCLPTVLAGQVWALLGKARRLLGK